MRKHRWAIFDATLHDQLSEITNAGFGEADTHQPILLEFDVGRVQGQRAIADDGASARARKRSCGSCPKTLRSNGDNGPHVVDGGFHVDAQTHTRWWKLRWQSARVLVRMSDDMDL